MGQQGACTAQATRTVPSVSLLAQRTAGSLPRVKREMWVIGLEQGLWVQRLNKPARPALKRPTPVG